MMINEMAKQKEQKMIKVLTNSLGSGDWIQVLGHSGSELFSGHSVGARELQEILDIVSRSGCELIECTDSEMEDGVHKYPFA